MTSITIQEMCTAIADTLGAADHLDYTQTPKTLSEGIHDTPLLQVYWDAFEQDPTNNADRTTFRGGMRQTDVTILADLYSRQLSDLAEGAEKTLTVIEELVAILEAQDTKPYFGLTGIKAFHWRIERATLVYGSQETKYSGARITLTLRVF